MCYSAKEWLKAGTVQLTRILSNGLILGQSPERFTSLMMKNLQTVSDKGRYQAQRLLRTEFARVQVSIQKESIEKNGFDEVIFIAAPGCCVHCPEVDGEVHEAKRSMPGENAPPMHPNCRCSIAPYMNEDLYYKWLDSYDEHEMSWEEWRETKKGPEKEKGISGQIGPWGSNEVDKKYIKSPEYRSKFTGITDNSNVNNQIRKFFGGVLTKYSGTDTEVMQVIDAETGKVILKKVGERQTRSIFD